MPGVRVAATRDTAMRTNRGAGSEGSDAAKHTVIVATRG